MKIPVPMLVLLSRRDSISPQDFRAYWQDVHGPLAARLQGLHHYRQLHLRHARGWWPECGDVDLEPGAADLVDGIADMAFASVEGQQAYAAVAHFTRNDEINLFRRSVRYMTDGATCEESTGRISSATTEAAGWRLCVLLRSRSSCSEPAFAQGVRELFAPLQAPCHATVWTLLSRDNSQNHLLAAHVDHDAPAERQYHAAAELVFGDAAQAHAFLGAGEFADRQRVLISAAHAYVVEEVAPMVLQGRMTTSGRRGHTIAQLIARVGAANQLDPAVAARFGERPRD